jgi:hypothetical protein
MIKLRLLYSIINIKIKGPDMEYATPTIDVDSKSYVASPIPIDTIEDDEKVFSIVWDKTKSPLYVKLSEAIEEDGFWYSIYDNINAIENEEDGLDGGLLEEVDSFDDALVLACSEVSYYAEVVMDNTQPKEDTVFKIASGDDSSEMGMKR